MRRFFAALHARPGLGAAFVFGVCLCGYTVNARLIAAADSIPARLIPFAVINRGTVYLDQYVPPGRNYFLARSRQGLTASVYPIVVPLLVTPLFAPAAIYVRLAQPDPKRFTEISRLVEKLSSAVIGALSVVALWLTLIQIANPATAWMLTWAYAFGTETWTIGSQALWQHGTAELLLACTLLLLCRFGASPKWAFVVGALGGLASMNRPPNALFTAAVALYFFLFGRGARLRFLFGLIASAAPFLGYDLYTFGHFFGGYGVRLHRDFFNQPILKGLAGLLMSPGKGLLVYSPFFIVLLATPLVRLGEAGRAVVGFFWIAVFGQLLLYATTDWTGGFCYGPRYLTDMLPFLVVCLVPAAEKLTTAAMKRAFGLLIATGIAVQAVGAFCYPRGGSASFTLQEMWEPSLAPFVVEAKWRFKRSLQKLNPPETDTGNER